MYQTLTVAESLALFAGYYERPRDVDEVVQLIGLEQKRDATVRTLSGGQRRRLDLGLALVGDPDLLFLDEPTTGFDPQARRRAWESISSLRALGKTILLTTHYLDEAERLCDRVAVLRDGRIAAIGRPGELTGALPPTEIRYRQDGREVVLAPRSRRASSTSSRRRRSPTAASSRRSRCGGRASRRSTSR